VRALVRAINDPDPKTRAAVVNALGKSGEGTDGVVAALEPRVRDPDAFVRNRAAIALARVAGAEVAALASSPELAHLIDPAALVIMHGLVGTADSVALALRALGDSTQLPAIQRFFDREDAAVCSTFLANLKLLDPRAPSLSTRLDPAALALQYERLLTSSQDANARRAAVEALSGSLGDAQIVVFAGALSADPDDTVRLRCASALARVPDNALARTALTRAASDPNPQVAVAAVEGLRTQRHPEVDAALFRRLGAGSGLVNQAIEATLAEIYRDDLAAFLDRVMGTDRPAALVAAMRVLERIGSPSASPLLAFMLESSDPDVRAAAARASAKADGPGAMRRIGKLLDDPHETVRIAALEVIAGEGPDAVVRLASARTDPSVAVRSRLCHLLDAFPTLAAQKVIDALLDDAAPRVKASALVTLLSFGELDSLRRFANHYTQADADVMAEVQADQRAATVTRNLGKLLATGGDGALRELAVRAIGALASEGYEGLLVPVLRDPRAAVRMAAARALASSDRPEIQERIRELRDDPELVVREAVRQALQRM
jgi:HEAT repeat protein